MKQFAVFDIDGTLIRWQLYHAVVDRLARKELLGSGAKQKLNQARMIWKNREHELAFHHYEKEIIRVYEQALQSLSPDDFDQTALEIIEEYKDQSYTYTRELIKQLLKKDYILLAISGSHQELIAHIARHYGFHDWVGSQYKRTAAGYSGERYIASSDKKKILKELIAKHNLSLHKSYAVGDSKSDASMLEIVEYPVAFNPDQQLYTIAQENRWPIVVERKNVIYKLKPSKEQYQLEL
jgi:HAD superfamily hydrolase (TIGR01490 family)